MGFAISGRLILKCEVGDLIRSSHNSAENFGLE